MAIIDKNVNTLPIGPVKHVVGVNEAGRGYRMPVEDITDPNLMPLGIDDLTYDAVVGVVAAVEDAPQKRQTLQHLASVSGHLVFRDVASAAALSTSSRVKSVRIISASAPEGGNDHIRVRVDAEPTSGPKHRSADRFTSTGTIDNANGGWWAFRASARADISSTNASASIRENGTGDVAIFVGEDGVEDSAQIEAIILDKETGEVSIPNGLHTTDLAATGDALVDGDVTASGALLAILGLLLRSPSVSAALRPDGSGNLGLYVGAANAAPEDQILALGINKTTGALTVNALTVYGISRIIANFADLRMLTPDGRGWRLISEATGTTPGNLTLQATTDGFVSNFTNAAVITPTGNVGVGTISPNAKLHIIGPDMPTGITALISGATKGLRFIFDSTLASIEAVDSTGVGSHQPLVLMGSIARLTSPGNHGVLVDGGGRVGIGTNAPGAELEVVALGGDEDCRVQVRATSEKIAQFLRSGGLTAIDCGVTDPFAIYVNAQPRFLIAGNGYTSIGQSGPATSLDVNGTSSDTFVRIRNTNNPFGFDIGVGAAVSPAYLFNRANTSMVFGTNNSDRWTITATGDFLPATDNVFNAGSGSNRIKELFAAAGTINTSDARLKADRDGNDITEDTDWKVSPLTPAELNVANRLASEIGIYVWKDAIEKKGLADARRHVGITVQRGIAICEEEGVDPWSLGIFCRDPVTKTVTKTELRNEQVYDEVQEPEAGFELNEDGIPVRLSATRTVKVPRTRKQELIDGDGNVVMQRVRAYDMVTETQLVIKIGEDGIPRQVEESVTRKELRSHLVQARDLHGKLLYKVEKRAVAGEKEGEIVHEDMTVPVMIPVPEYIEEPVLVDVPVKEMREVTFTVEEPDGDILGFRHDELLMFIIRGVID